ncbi:hypothetical protein FB567DRAFT_554829 [Paraphoma chrysanthemicola]|uniref:Uncharacterized protein n=1 Tax=Paraphoma chrysanthemicola TaxID=798071 RepID=A0A8K0QUS9_9PLEO|nr:hypothetical protein FB567DRAFT_554829 [Paraphoma chrysanthemicola]
MSDVISRLQNVGGREQCMKPPLCGLRHGVDSMKLCVVGCDKHVGRKPPPHAAAEVVACPCERRRGRGTAALTSDILSSVTGAALMAGFGKRDCGNERCDRLPRGCARIEVDDAQPTRDEVPSGWKMRVDPRIASFLVSEASPAADERVGAHNVPQYQENYSPSRFMINCAGANMKFPPCARAVWCASLTQQRRSPLVRGNKPSTAWRRLDTTSGVSQRRPKPMAKLCEESAHELHVFVLSQLRLKRLRLRGQETIIAAKCIAKHHAAATNRINSRWEVRRAIGEEAVGVTATRLVHMGMLPSSCRSQTSLGWTPDPRSRAFGTQPSVRQCGTVTPPSWVQSCPHASCICGGEAHNRGSAQRRSHPQDECTTILSECDRSLCAVPQPCGTQL